MDVIISFTPPGTAAGRHRGYTLTELIVILALMAVALTLAIPSFADLLQHNRLTTSINTLASTLHYTRSEAIKRNTATVLCKGTPAGGCDRIRAWHDGWIVFADYDHDRSWGHDEPLLWSQPALNPSQSLIWNAFPSSNYLVYYPSGTASSNGTFVFCDPRGAAAAKALVIAKSGRVRLADKAANGAALQCP